MSLRLDEPRDDVECPECHGTGSVRVICGEDDEAAPCIGCGGRGRVILLDVEQGDGYRDLRLVPDAYDERDVMGNESGKEAAA